MARKSFWCRLGWHKWGPQHDEHGERYLGCVRCHKRTDPGHMLPIDPVI
jgi:hypothetical protein